MAVTEFQSRVLQLLARSRINHGESYVAGGLALNYQLKTPRVSHDIDIFNDSQEALTVSWESDRKTLLADGYEVEPKRERPFFVEATVRKNGSSTDVQWAHDSAYRFFPLLQDDLMGLTLHPLDLAANKLLALVGRNAPRDWVDTIQCCQLLQPLPYLVWAACGKDPGFSPAMILELAARVRYNQVELDRVVSSDPKPDAAALCASWHAAIAAARRTLLLLPPEHAGTCVTTASGDLFKGTDDSLLAALAADTVRFHEGRIGGAWPTVLG